MNKIDKETLSQLMDGEWQDLDPAQSVKACCADNELKAKWSRYHLARDVMRNEAIAIDTADLMAGLSSRISDAIADEPTYSNVSAISPGIDTGESKNHQVAQEIAQPNASISSTSISNTSKFNWRTGLTGLALAACVALATVIGLNIWQGAPGSNSATNVAQTVVAPVPGVVLPEVEYVSNRGTYWVTSDARRSAKAEKRLNALLSTHIERSPTAERSGMLPYSRLVGYDSVNSEQ